MQQLEFIQLAKKGDTNAFYSLICMYKIQMYKIAYSFFQNEQDALEAIQDTTYRAFNNLHKLKQPQYFKTWLFKILINYCIDENKRKKKLTMLDETEPMYENNDIDRSIVIDEAISKLNTKYKSVILLKYFDDLTINDIAFIMNKPTGTIKTWLSKALNELRQILGEEESNDEISRRKASTRTQNSL